MPAPIALLAASCSEPGGSGRFASDPLGYAVEWPEFTSGLLLLEAMNSQPAGVNVFD
jgi:hypothetical protein